MLLEPFASARGWEVYVILGLLVAGESSAVLALLLPGEVTLLVAGVLVTTGRASLPIVLVVAVVAAVAGHAAGYEIGRRHGLRVLRWRPLRRLAAGADRAGALLARHGAAALLLGRWSNVGRVVVPLLAGARRMPYGRFMLYNVLGGIVWTVTFVLLGRMAGSSIEGLVRALGGVAWVVTAAVAIGSVVALRRRAGRRGTSTQGPVSAGAGR